MSPVLKLYAFFFALILPFSSFGMLPVETQGNEESPTPEVSFSKAIPPELASPRDTLRTFLSGMNDVKRGDSEGIADALTTLDLSEVSSLVRRERGERLAWLLLEVMDRTRLIDLNSVPLETSDSLWTFETYEKGAIRIRRQEDGRWLFDAATLRQLPEIYQSVSRFKRLSGLSDNSEYLPWDIRLRNMVPGFLKGEVFLLENWRWLALLVVIALGMLADWLVSMFLRRTLRRWFDRRPNYYTDVKDRDDRLRPLGIMAMSLVWWVGLNAIGLPETALLILLVAVKALTSIAAVWAAYRLVDLLAAWLTAYANRTDNKLDDVLLPLIPRTLKVFVTVIGIVFVADNLNIDVTGLLAGLGLGGLAFALAAKDMVQNLFGSVTVLLDRTFSVGDWIVVEGQEGTVERMGFRSTRIRTFYNSLVTIPNSKFITAEVDNMGERRYRRYKAHFGLAYDTPPEKIEAFCEGLRELVRQHPYMRKDYFHVYLNDLGSDSLSVLVYVFWETPDWSTELRERHRFLLDSLRLAKRLGVEYAFPTQTLYLRNEEAPTHAAMALDAASKQGRAAAHDIVAETTGVGVKPPPVQIT
jgi:MscS family membrane protein